MGLDYSYEILVPARNVRRPLIELAELAPPTRRVPPLTLTLPGTINHRNATHKWGYCCHCNIHPPLIIPCADRRIRRR